jgi:hypothetical protein
MGLRLVIGAQGGSEVATRGIGLGRAQAHQSGDWIGHARRLTGIS